MTDYSTERAEVLAQVRGLLADLAKSSAVLDEFR
jgi:hypothetical protein